jgi:hypothetical protein
MRRKHWQRRIWPAKWYKSGFNHSRIPLFIDGNKVCQLWASQDSKLYGLICLKSSGLPPQILQTDTLKWIPLASQGVHATSLKVKSSAWAKFRAAARKLWPYEACRFRWKQKPGLIRAGWKGRASLHLWLTPGNVLHWHRHLRIMMSITWWALKRVNRFGSLGRRESFAGMASS